MATDFHLKTPQKYKSIDERWDWILTYMVVEDKFVHEMLMCMEKRPSKHLPTMGITVEDSTRIVLYYNPDFVDKLTDPELRFVITHEIYHVALHHVTIRVPEHPEDRGLYNKAADLAINCLIPQGKFEYVNRHMPEAPELKGIMPKDFGFEDKFSMEQYIQLLRNKKDDGQDGSGNTYGSESGKGDGSEKPEEDDGDAQSSKPGDKKGKQKSNSFDVHDGWAESESLREIIRNKIEQLAKDERVWGSMPGDVKAIIMAAQRSKVSWAKYLRRYLGDLVTTQNERTMKRPNKRFGYPYCGTKRLHVDRKLVAIDTSGSIGDDDLAQFLVEINKLSEILPVDLIMFDHEIQTKIMPFERKRVSMKFEGRGGTCFEPVMELAAARHYQSLIMLTDGAAAAPEKPARVKDILWVITGTGKPPVDWGTVIHIEPKKALKSTNA